MAFIEDGRGSGRKQSVSSTQRGNVSAKTAPRIMYASRDDGLAFVAIYDGITADAGDYVAYLKNDSSTRNLFISTLSAGGVEAIKWKLWAVTGTAAAGEAVTPGGLNLSKSIPAEATAMAGNVPITGLTTAGQCGTSRSMAAGSVRGSFQNSLILGPGDAIAIEYNTGVTGVCELEIHFHYENLGAS